MAQTRLQQDWINDRKLICFTILCLFLLYISYLIRLNIYSKQIKPEITIKYLDNGFLIKTSGCRIPYLDPFDRSILEYIFKEKPLKCSNKQPLVESDLDSIYIDKQQLSSYNVSNQDMLSCCYQPFWRKTISTDESHISGKCRYFNSSAKISHEFIKVICKVNKKEIYKDFHSFLPIKKKTNKTQEKLNVLVIGLDAMSRLNFQRQLPLTKKYLKKLKAIEMLGYNKVGDNTFPNVIPILTGKSFEELIKSCWPSYESKFDNCDYIWNNYSKAGYLTSYAEDASPVGLFNYERHGFYKQPTDYYWRTFNALAEKEIGHLNNRVLNLCIGPRPTYLVLLNYIKKLFLSLKNESYFAFSWTVSLSHDYLNLPSQGDKYYKLFIDEMKKNNNLNDTVLIVVSDHGMRVGDIRLSYQGHLEDRLPCLFFVFPPWFSKKYPSAVANVRKNSKRLTTPFDLHETLADILHTELLTSDNIRQRSKELYNKRGISLFLLVPENRTCSSAGISAHWCTCQKSVEISKTSYVVQKAAKYIVTYMNDLLKGYKNCATLELDTIMNARLSASDDYLEDNQPIHDYTVTLKTKPGGGLFEGTVRCQNCKFIYVYNFDLIGTISRLNLYGNQSACITDFNLKLYCYCNN